MISTICFYIFASVLVVSAMLVITARNPVHSVLFLILSFFNATGLFVLLGAEFVGMIMAIVYVGAVAVLFLFVVMMLDVDFAGLRKGAMQYIPLGLFIGIVLLIELGLIYTAWNRNDIGNDVLAAPVLDGSELSNTQALGQVLYTDYFFAFQMAGVILLVAMVGAISLTLRHRSNVRRQDIGKQLSATGADVVETRKVKTGRGIA